MHKNFKYFDLKLKDIVNVTKTQVLVIKLRD